MENELFEILPGLKPVDPGVLEAFEREMTGHAIPEIMRAVEKRRLLAAESRNRQMAGRGGLYGGGLRRKESLVLGIDLVRFARRLGESRRALMWPVGLLAERAGLPETRVRALEDGGLAPELREVLALEGALGLTRGDLLRGQTWRAA